MVALQTNDGVTVMRTCYSYTVCSVFCVLCSVFARGLGWIWLLLLFRCCFLPFARRGEVVIHRAIRVSSAVRVMSVIRGIRLIVH